MIDLKRLARLERPAPFFFASKYAKELQSAIQTQGARDVIFCPMSEFPVLYPDLPESGKRPAVPLNALYPKVTTTDPTLITVLISSFRPQDLTRLLRDFETDPKIKKRLSAAPKTDPDTILKRIGGRR